MKFVLDSGIYSGHYEFSNVTFLRRESKSFIHNERNPFQDDNGHGTHVSSLIAGKYYGVSPCTQLVSVKIVNHQGQDLMRQVLD